jgi:hypothetical protein
MARLEIAPGTRWGRLTYVGEGGLDKRKRRAVVVRCDCGATKTLGLANIKKGMTRSCGCLRREVTAKKNMTHGMTNTPEYKIWDGILDRCNVRGGNTNPKKDYAGRGIMVCQRWQGTDGFANFFADMGERPSASHSIDRIDNSGNYEPGNCAWATRHQQARNTRRNRIITFQGRSMCLADWAEEAGISRKALHARLDRHGWTLEMALTTPMRPQKRATLAGCLVEAILGRDWATLGQD